MLVAVVVLMLITSMGIFGFLSKAHSDQAVPAGDAVAKIQILDEKIAIQQEYIKQARKDIDVLNTQIDRYNELGAVSRGVKVRDQQKAERETLLAQIDSAQTAITKLREDRAPIAASMRAIEAEVGPIKYIAAFVYGDDPDANILEKAVTWVIITIVFVFDPLAVLLLLASQMSFQWAREEKEYQEDIPSTPFFNNEPNYEPDDGPLTEEQIELIKESVAYSDPHTPGWMYKAHTPETHPYLYAGSGVGFKNLKPMVYKPEEKIKVKETETDSVVEEALKWAGEQKELSALRDEVKKYGYSKEKDTYRVREKSYTQEEFDLLMGTSYVQNEEQTQSGAWSKINSKITEEEYLKKASTKKDDNTDNAA